MTLYSCLPDALHLQPTLPPTGNISDVLSSPSRPATSPMLPSLCICTSLEEPLIPSFLPPIRFPPSSWSWSPLQIGCGHSSALTSRWAPGSFPDTQSLHAPGLLSSWASCPLELSLPSPSVRSSLEALCSLSHRFLIGAVSCLDHFLCSPPSSI